MTKYLFPYLLNFIISLLITIFGIFCYLNPRLFQGNTLNEYSNSYCQNISNSKSIICKNKFKKKKFILLLIDGTAFDELEFLLKPEKHNLTRVYKNFDKEFKITGSNFETMFTGKFSRNYKYKPFNADNFFRQLHNSGYNLTYLGDKSPIFKFLNMEKNIELNSYKLEIENISLSNLCDDSYNIEDKNIEKYLKENSDKIGLLKITKEQMYQTLDEYFKNSSFSKLNISKCLEKKFHISESGEKFGIIYYSTVLDHYNHKYSKKHYKTILQAYSIDSYLNKIYEFINENPEFALIIGSDHGGSLFPGDDEVISHGSNVDGNEGIFLIYTKELSKFKKNINDNNKFEIINRYHYAPSMPLIIQDINIPLESIEMPILFFNDSFWEENVILMKVFQMEEFFRKGSLKVKKLKNLFDKYISDTFMINREKINFNEKKKKLINLHLKGIEILKKNLIPFKYYVLFFLFQIFFIGKTIFEIIFMKNIFKEKNQDLKLFYFNIIGSFLPLIILFLPFNFEVEKKINFIILYSSFFILGFMIFTMNYSGLFTLIILVYNIILILFFKIRLFHKIKYLISGFYTRKISSMFSFIIITFYIYFNFKKKLYENFLDSNINVPIFYLILFLCLFISFLILIFHLTKPFYNEGIRNIFLNDLIYFLLFILLLIIIIIPKDKKGNKTIKCILTKLYIFLLQSFIIEDADILFIIIFLIPLFEYLNYIYENEKGIKKIFIWQIFLIFFEIFFLLTKETFEIKSHPNLSLREITKNGKKFEIFLTIHIEANYSLILFSYLFQFTSFPNDKFINSKSMLMRLLNYIKSNIISLFLFYNVFIKKIEGDVIKIIYYTGLYTFLIIIDGIYCFIFYYLGEIEIYKSFCSNYIGYQKIEISEFDRDKENNIEIT